MAAILAALAPTGEELVRWTPIREALPGNDFWAKSRAVQRLYDDGAIYMLKLAGSPYVCLGDDADRELARRAKAQNRPRSVRVA